ncbi:phage tail tip fiber protein [Aeromonas salmonicida]|uniref:phage tail tip fiber protein n=1 Tax=Aeromonas salmonicida TaxID=645 RepID=UPI003D2282D3
MATVAVVTSIISIVASAVSLAISLSMKTPSQEQNDYGIGIDRRGNDNPMLVPFGNCLVPMASVYNNVNNQNTNYLAQIFNIGIGEVKSIQQLYINGVPYFDIIKDQGTGWVNQGLSSNFPNVAVGLKRGLATEAPMFQKIIDNSDGEVNLNFRGDGCATVSVLAERWITQGGDNEIRFVNPKNKWEALVQGIPVIDPRIDPNCLGKTDKSKRVWGSSFYNPACVILTYLLDGYFGMGFEVEDIDITSFIILANYCDQQNIQFNGFINQDQTRGEMMKSFADSFGGEIYIESGILKVRALSKTPATVHLSEQNMLSEIKVLGKGAEEYANVIKIEYLNTDSNFSQDQYVIPKNEKTDPVIKKDGYIKEKTIKMPYITDGGNYELVKFFANRAMKQAQLVKKSISFKIDNTVTKLKLGDVVEISNIEYKMDRKKFRIISIKSSMEGDKILISEIEATEYIESVYDRGAYQSGGSSGSLPDPTLRIDPPSNLVFTQNSGTVQGNGVLSWSSQYKGEQRNEVQYRKTGSPLWVSYQTVTAESVTITNLQTGTSYDFRVRTQAAIGYSRWTELLNQRIAKVLNLPAVKNLNGNFTGKDAVIKWDAIKGPIDSTGNPVAGFTDLSELVSYYQVQIAHNTIGNVKSTYIVTDPAFTYTLEQNLKDGLSRNIIAIIKPVSIYSDVGAQASTNMYNAPMAQPSGVAVSAQLKSLTVTWDNPSEPSLGILDYASSDIYLVPTQQTVASDQYLLATSNTGSFTKLMPDSQKTGWIRIAHRDVFGHTSPITASPALYYSQTTIDDLITDSEFDQNMKEIEDNLAAAEADITKAKSDIIKNATDITTTKQTVTAQGAQINQVSTVASGNSGKIASLETTLEATEADLNAKITVNKNAITTTNSAMAQMDTRLTASIGANTASIQQQGIAIANTDSALSSYKTSNNAEVAGVKSSVTTVSQAQATTAGKVSAIWGLKVDANGKTAGLTLGATAQGSTVDFLADTFRIASATNGTAVTAFEVRNGSVMMRNALIGSLTASQISADAINGNHIASNSIIVAGSGATSATLNGSDPTWRIYAGSTTPASAPFRVTGSGQLVATNANITGAITATSGSFTGAITASSGNVTGRLNVGTAYIDGRAGQNFLTGASGRFVVDDSGNMTCQYAVINGGTFNGQVAVEHLVGDVYRKGFYVLPTIPPVILGGGSGQREFMRANIGSQDFNQRLVLSIIEIPVAMYDNPGKCEVWYQVEGQSPTWLVNIDGPSNTKAKIITDFSVMVPAGKTYVRFYILPFNRVTYQRVSPINGVIEMMKYEQIGFSVSSS